MQRAVQMEKKIIGPYCGECAYADRMVYLPVGNVADGFDFLPHHVKCREFCKSNPDQKYRGLKKQPNDG